MNIYLLLMISITVASFYSVLLHKLPPGTNIFRTNLSCALIWILLLFIINGGRIEWNTGTVFYGALYGVVQVLFLLSKTKAMSSGPVSITTLIGNCSMLLSVIVSLLIWQENASIGQILGLVLLLAAVFLCTYSKSEMALTGQWKRACVMFFVLAASVGIVFKFFSKSQYRANAGDMMLIAAIVMSLLLGMIVLSGKKENTRGKIKQLNWSFIIFILLCGVCSCIQNRLNIYLSGILPGAVFFPCFNGGVIVLSSLLGKLILHEKLSGKQIIGLVLGTISVCMVGI